MLNGLLDDYTTRPRGTPRGRQWRRIVIFSLFLVSGWLLPGGVCAGERNRPIRIGVLTPSWGPPPQVIGLRDGLQELGYREGEQFVIGVRFTQGNITALHAAALELVKLGPDPV